MKGRECYVLIRRGDGAHLPCVLRCHVRSVSGPKITVVVAATEYGYRAGQRMIVNERNIVQ